ncbi:MAG: DUF58 domain-containing protein [Cyanophyceae cyanobacterium]
MGGDGQTAGAVGAIAVAQGKDKPNGQARGKAPQRWRRRWTDALERRWLNPSYQGWLLLFFTIFFFAAATNSMAGWLYVISGVLLALLAVAAVLSARSLRSLTVVRRPVAAVHSGDGVTVELEVRNLSPQPRPLLLAIDRAPAALGPEAQCAIELLAPGEMYLWRHRWEASRRGVYVWQGVRLRSAAPFGLFWTRRDLAAPAKVVVYPQVLTLRRCPIADRLGLGGQLRAAADPRNGLAATEGLTRSLRPYRWGDSMRLIHWRSSARSGALQVRELETVTTGEDLAIALDPSGPWTDEGFEQLAIAAASLYAYGSRRQINPRLWLPETGWLRGRQVILEALAALNPSPAAIAPPQEPILWLTANAASVRAIAPGSAWIWWNLSGHSSGGSGPSLQLDGSGLILQVDQPLALQLQQHPSQRS